MKNSLLKEPFFAADKSGQKLDHFLRQATMAAVNPNAPIRQGYGHT
jgi:hypothetical protein